MMVIIKDKLWLVLVGVFVLSLAVVFVSAAELPTVGGDDDVWGTVLNEFLNVSLNDTGHLRANNMSFGGKITFALGEIIDNFIDGWIRITGNLNVSGDIETSGNLNISGVYYGNGSGLTDIGADSLGVGSVNTAHILDGTIIADDIAAGSVNTSHILDGNITTAKIDGAAVTNIKVAANAINTTQIIDGTILAGDLAADSVNTTHILDSTITDDDINDSTNLTLGQKITFALGGFIQNIVSGWFEVNGSLNVSDDVVVGGDLNVTGDIRSLGEYFFYDGSTQSVASTPDAFSWHVGSASFGEYFNISDQETGAQGLFFKPDGTKMYVIGPGSDNVSEYNLSTPWEISSAVFYQSAASDLTNPKGIFFRQDGLMMYIVETSDDNISGYDLSTAWDVSTLSSSTGAFDVTTNESNPTGVFFRPDGLKMYVVGTNQDNINEYDLSTPWNVTTASFNQLFNISSEDSAPNDIFFRSDGAKMYVPGATEDKIYEYSLSTPWDVSTAYFDQSLNVSSEDATIQAAFFKPDGTKMYVLGHTNDGVYEYGMGLIVGGDLNVSGVYYGNGSGLTGIGADSLGVGSVNTTHILDGTIIAQDIALDVINTSHILDGNITDAKIDSLNWSKLIGVPSDFSDEVDNNTLYYAGGVYIYKNGSDYFILNETKLNSTIDDLILLNETNGAYIYDSGRKIYLNETVLNATINSIGNYSAGDGITIVGKEVNATLGTSIDNTEIESDSINTTQIIDSTITDADINDSTNLTLGEKITFALGGFIQNIVSGWVEVNGSLNVSGNIQANNNLTVSDYFFLSNDYSLPPGQNKILKRNSATKAVFGVQNEMATVSADSGAGYVLNTSVGEYRIDLHGALDTQNPNDTVHHLLGANNREIWRLNSDSDSNFRFESALDKLIFGINKTGAEINGTLNVGDDTSVGGDLNVSGVYYGDGSGLTDIGADSLGVGSVNTTHILDGTIVDADISDSTNLTLGEKITFALGGFIQNIVSGWMEVNGSLNVSDSLVVDKNLTVDSGTLFVDSDNDRVGIGTISPTQALDVDGSVNITNNLTFGTGGNMYHNGTELIIEY
jgi:hypothetical protein